MEGVTDPCGMEGVTGVTDPCGMEGVTEWKVLQILVVWKGLYRMEGVTDPCGMEGVTDAWPVLTAPELPGKECLSMVCVHAGWIRPGSCFLHMP